MVRRTPGQAAGVLIMVLCVDIAGKIGVLDLAVSFEAPVGVTALVGPSGAGKSTVLNAIAGLWQPSKGVVKLGERMFFDGTAGISLAPHKRNIGAVFQRPLLFPHMNVERNLRYGITPDADFESVVDLLDIKPLLARMPRNLSGGEAQRVSIGRALLSKPQLFLLDEPMTGLDETRRSALMPYLLSLCETLTVPIIYVTHKTDELAQIAQQVVPMDAGHSVSAMMVNDFLDLVGDTSIAQN